MSPPPAATTNTNPGKKTTAATSASRVTGWSVTAAEREKERSATFVRVEHTQIFPTIPSDAWSAPPA